MASSRSKLSNAVAVELTVVAAIIFWLAFDSAVMESASKVLCIFNDKFGASPAADNTTLLPDIAADKVIILLLPVCSVPYCVTKAFVPSCTTSASVTPVSVLALSSISITYFAALNDACANVSILSDAESTSVLEVVTVTPTVASDVLALEIGIL